MIEALVLQNTLLPATLLSTAAGKEQTALPILILPQQPATSTTSNAQSSLPPTTLYRINVEWQNKLIQLLSSQPLPTGTRVPLQIDARGVIKLLPPDVAAKILLAQNTATNTAVAQPVAAPTPAQTLQQSFRELLPRQEALHTLVPLLQKFITPDVRAQLPQPIAKAVAQLLQSLPKPAQLNTAENVKQALSNSGSFLEAKLAQATLATPGAERLPQIAATDLKAQIATLLALTRQFAPQSPPQTATPSTAAQFTADDEFVYTKPTVHNTNAPLDNAINKDSESVDSLLSQLGKLLQAGFARIQLNQLDSANARHLNHDTQAPVPTWVLELPLRTQHGVDQLQLRIEQRHHQQQQQQRTRVQWNVDIAFDLHAAGKFAASLAIIDKSISATLWAEQKQTHLRIREEMDYLRAGLESVGVKVTEMHCRHGLPPARANPISQQLVDVHT